MSMANCARLCRTSVCVKRTSSFGADERRCKRGIIATCYYLFVGRLVTQVGQPSPLPPMGDRARELARGMVGRESISNGFVCANHIGWWLSGARSACKPLTHDKHQPITEEHPSGAHPPRVRARARPTPAFRLSSGLIPRHEGHPSTTDALNFRRFSLKSSLEGRAHGQPGWRRDKGETTPTSYRRPQPPRKATR